jgi:hypothetical protein
MVTVVVIGARYGSAPLNPVSASGLSLFVGTLLR